MGGAFGWLLVGFSDRIPTFSYRIPTFFGQIPTSELERSEADQKAFFGSESNWLEKADPLAVLRQWTPENFGY